MLLLWLDLKTKCEFSARGLRNEKTEIEFRKIAAGCGITTGDRNHRTFLYAIGNANFVHDA